MHNPREMHAQSSLVVKATSSNLMPELPTTQCEQAEQTVAVVPSPEAVRGHLNATMRPVHVYSQHGAVKHCVQPTW
jgi:hypothetical protein